MISFIGRSQSTQIPKSVVFRCDIEFGTYEALLSKILVKIGDPTGIPQISCKLETAPFLIY